MNYLKVYLCLAALVATGVASNEAEASHKAWLMKNSGVSCVRQYPEAGDYYPGMVQNKDPWGVYVTCPITLAGRSGSSSDPKSSAKRWLAAKQARIHYKQTSSPFWCQARAENSFGSVYYSRGRWSAGGGVRTMDLIDNEYDWGGALEAAETGDFTQLDFECRVGSRGSGRFPDALLYGVDVATCQYQDECDSVHEDVSQNSESTVQGSGIECAPASSWSAGQLQRTVNGFYNPHDELWGSLSCPITTASDDSFESVRHVHLAHVYWEGPRAPSCRLVSWDAQGNKSWSPYLQQHSDGYLKTQGSFDAGVEKTLSFECGQPPHTTIVGWEVRHSVTRNSPGR